MTLFQESLAQFSAYLLNGDFEALQALFSGEPLINTPLQGEVRGSEAFAQFVRVQQQWFKDCEVRQEVFAVTSTDQRTVIEFVLYLQQGGEIIDLPVALVADREGAGASAIRVYYSTWPLTREHIVRPPLLRPAEHLEEPEIIRQYMDGLGKPDKAKVLALFEDDGYVREPSGARYRHTGPQGRQEFYGMALDGGSISLKHCTATFDGIRCAVEYICDGWGNMPLPPQAGIAVYELGETGRLCAVRIYDDVSAPGERRGTGR